MNAQPYPAGTLPVMDVRMYSDLVRLAIPAATGAVLQAGPHGNLLTITVTLDPHAFTADADGGVTLTVPFSQALELLDCTEDLGAPVRVDSGAETISLDARCAGHSNPLVRELWSASQSRLQAEHCPDRAPGPLSVSVPLTPAQS